MEKNTNYERALDFLLYSYFEFDGGIDGIQSGDDMKMRCAQRAYQDLARTVKYKYSTSMLENMNKKSRPQKEKDEAKAFQDKKSKLINGVCSIIIEEIDKITEIKEHDTFKNWHDKMCSYIIGLMNAKNSVNI